MQCHHHLCRRGRRRPGSRHGPRRALVLARVGGPASISSGTLNIGTESFTVGDGGVPDKCWTPLPTPTIAVHFSGSATSGTWVISGSFKVRFRLAPPNDAQYWQADISFLTANGTYGGTAPNYTLTSSPPHHLTLELKFYRLTPPDCAKTDLACTARVRLVTTNTTVTGTLPGGAGTMTLNAPSNVAGGVPLTVVSGVCPATITSRLIGKHVSLSLAIDF